jgi:hypothetical protein
MCYELFDPEGSRSHVVHRTPAAPTANAADSGRMVRGDANGDGVVDVADVLATLAFARGDRTGIACPGAADANDDGTVDVGDAVATLSGYLTVGPESGRAAIASDGTSCSPVE